MLAQSYYSQAELAAFQFRSLGKNVKISRHTSLYRSEEMSFGDNVRIDDFCILSGHITLGSHIHISAYCGLYGSHGIEIHDYAGISPQSLIFSATDDFSGTYLVGPQHSDAVRGVMSGTVIIEKCVQVGAGSIIMPRVTLKEGAATGALTLVKENLPAWTISVGIPSRVLKKRSKEMLALLEKE